MALVGARSRSRRARRPGINDSQACTAALNAGELSFSPWCSMCTPPPENVGSGKFGTPWERMHAAAFRYCPCSEGVIWWLPSPPGPPPGSSLLAGLLRRLEMGIARDRRIDRDRHAPLVAVGGDFWVGEVGHAVCAHARRVRDGLAARRGFATARRAGRCRARRGRFRRVRPDARHAPARRATTAARHEHAEGDEGHGQSSHSQSLGGRGAPVAAVSGVALHVVSFAARKVVLCAACTTSDGFGNVSPPKRWTSPPAKPSLKPPGSSLEHTPDQKRSPAVKEE